MPFDIDKLRSRGIDERSIKICEAINENNRRRDSCGFHEFVDGDRLSRSKCINCGCEVDSYYVQGYMDGIKHQKGQK